MKNYLRSGTRVRQETPHLTRLQASLPRRNNFPTIPMTPTNRNPRQTPMSVRPHCQEQLQIFRSTHCLLFLLEIRPDRHQNTPGSPSPRRPPNGAEAPKSQEMQYSRPNYSPCPPLNYCLILV